MGINIDWKYLQIMRRNEMGKEKIKNDGVSV